MIPIFIPIPIPIPMSEQELDVTCLDIIDLPSDKTILLFLLSIIPAWALSAWIWTSFGGMTWTDFGIATNLCFTFFTALLTDIVIWGFGSIFIELYKK